MLVVAFECEENTGLSPILLAANIAQASMINVFIILLLMAMQSSPEKWDARSSSKAYFFYLQRSMMVEYQSKGAQQREGSKFGKSCITTSG